MLAKEEGWQPVANFRLPPHSLDFEQAKVCASVSLPLLPTVASGHMWVPDTRNNTNLHPRPWDPFRIGEEGITSQAESLSSYSQTVGQKLALLEILGSWTSGLCPGNEEDLKEEEKEMFLCN